MFRKLMIVLLFVLVGLSIAQGEVLAKGKGIVVTESEVNSFKERITGNFIPTKKAILKYLLKVKLFALEALKINLAKNRLNRVKNLNLEDELYLYNLYKEHLLSKCAVSDESVESYYYAHWRKYIKKKNRNVCYRNKDKDTEMVPLAEVADKIRNLIKSFKERNLVEAEFNRLMEKYGVRIIGNVG